MISIFIFQNVACFHFWSSLFEIQIGLKLLLKCRKPITNGRKRKGLEQGWQEKINLKGPKV
jgi:hypothetical protein